MHVEPIFRHISSCPLVLDFGSLHQKPLVFVGSLHQKPLILISSVLPDASKFVVNFVEILTEVTIHGLLSDACTLDTCSVTNDRLRRSLAS